MLQQSSLGERENETDTKPVKKKKLTILLVEDNEDFRFYLKDNLRQFYNIIEAGNGNEGWNKVLQLHPDLIVSDVNMPEMNGIELCKKIKGDNCLLYTSDAADE